MKIKLDSTDKKVDNEIEKYKEREINSLKSMFTLNPQTNRYDYDGDLNKNDLSILVSEDKDGFIINFGKVTGDFNCCGLGLKSLKGAPQEVGRDFNCSWNKLTSLEGAPKIVDGWFDCPWNELTSLKGAPQKVGEGFNCVNNFNLYSLEGIGEVKGAILRSYNIPSNLKLETKELEATEATDKKALS